MFKDVNLNDFLYNNITNFFNPASILDVFTMKNGTNFFLPLVQDFLSSNTCEFIKNLWILTKDNNNIIQNNSNISLIKTLIESDNLLNTDLYNINFNLVSEMFLLTKPKTEPFYIIEALPEHKDTLEIFEALSVNTDNYLYANLNIPELKLHYPEPFIALPSFLHEEL